MSPYYGTSAQAGLWGSTGNICRSLPAVVPGGLKQQKGHKDIVSGFFYDWLISFLHIIRMVSIKLSVFLHYLCVYCF